MMNKLAVGVDIGGTNTIFGLVDSEGNVFVEDGFLTQEYHDIDRYIEQLHSGIVRLIEKVEDEVTLLGIGIGAPNANSERGTIEHAPNIPWAGGVVPIVEMLGALFDGMPVRIINDAKAAALGEMMFGGAREMRDFMVVTLGTGVGGGFVANAELVYGHDGFAGEIGHTTINRAGRLCGCGRRGCLEAYVSASGVVQTTLELLDTVGHESALKELSPSQMTAKTISLSAEKGDKIAIEAYRYTGVLLGEALANIAAVTSPEAIFIVGGVAKAGRWIFEPTREQFEQNLLPIYRNKIMILPSAITKESGAIIGAASLIFRGVRINN